jgi:hypothetical protein
MNAPIGSGSGSTPRKVRPTGNRANLETTRDSILKEVGGIQIYPIEEIIGTVLAPVPDNELQQVKRELGIQNVKEWIKIEMKCTECDMPSKSGLREADIFSNISRIFNEMAKTAQDLRIATPCIVLIDQPNRPPKGNAAFNTRPDATFQLQGPDPQNIPLRPGLRPRPRAKVDEGGYRDALENGSWTGVAATVEYKPNDDERAVEDVQSTVFPFDWLIDHSSRTHGKLSSTYFRLCLATLVEPPPLH